MKQKNIIAFSNQKGGVGKTTSVVNVADFLAKSGNSVLLVDLDPQGNATSALGVSKNTIGLEAVDLLEGKAKLNEIACSTSTKGLSLLPTTQKLAQFSQSPRSAADITRLRGQLLASSYDYVLIDCPPSLDALTYSALAAAGGVIVPLQAEYFALEGLGQLIDTIAKVRAGFNPQVDILGILLTMFDTRTSLSKQVAEQAQLHFPSKVFEAVIPRNVRLAEAPSHGQTIREYDNWSKGARAYKKLTKEIIERLN